MKAIFHMSVFLMLSLTMLSLVHGKERAFTVIVHPDNPVQTIEESDLTAIFLGKTTLWENRSPVAPAMLPERHKTMRRFIKTVLNKTLNQYRAYWKRRLFSGGGTPPRTFKSARTLMKYIGKHPGGIGIIPADFKPGNTVKVIKLVDLSNNMALTICQANWNEGLLLRKWPGGAK